MRSKPRKIEDEELDPYATERVNAVSDLFPDERLRKEFGLKIRECYFVRAYAVLHNAQRSAMIAGYTYRVSRAAYKIVRNERVSRAIEAVVSEAVNPITNIQTIMNVNTTVSRLMEIIKNPTDNKASVMASKALLDYYGSGIISIGHADDVQNEDVPDSEISASLKRMGVIADG